MRGQRNKETKSRMVQERKKWKGVIFCDSDKEGLNKEERLSVRVSKIECACGCVFEIEWLCACVCEIESLCESARAKSRVCVCAVTKKERVSTFVRVKECVWKSVCDWYSEQEQARKTVVQLCKWDVLGANMCMSVCICGCAWMYVRECVCK